MSLPAEYFDGVYRGAEDPWGFRDRWYEQRKYALTLAALPRRRYRAAFEPGCSIGVLTEQLAARCDHLVAMDPVPRVVEAARVATLGLGVQTRTGSIPRDWPAGPFDLIVLSEVAYYLSGTDLRLLAARLVSSLQTGGDLIAVHWRGHAPDYPSTADDVHRVLRERTEITRIGHYTDADFLLEVFRRGAAVSVAQQEGLR